MRSKLIPSRFKLRSTIARSRVSGTRSRGTIILIFILQSLRKEKKKRKMQVKISLLNYSESYGKVVRIFTKSTIVAFTGIVHPYCFARFKR